MAAHHARIKFVKIGGDCGTAPCEKMLWLGEEVCLIEVWLRTWSVLEDGAMENEITTDMKIVHFSEICSFGAVACTCFCHPATSNCGAKSSEPGMPSYV